MSKVRLLKFDACTNSEDNIGLIIGEIYDVVEQRNKGEVEIMTDLGSMILFAGEYEYV